MFSLLKIKRTKNIHSAASPACGLNPIWINEFTDSGSWHAARQQIETLQSVSDFIDDRVLNSRHEVPIQAWCGVCRKVTTMRFRWYYSTINHGGSVAPPWTETPNCDECLLNSRMRAAFSLLREIGANSDSLIYATEAVTDGFKKLKEIYPKSIGSEYFGENIKPGEKRVANNSYILHQDLTKLSFNSSSFDFIISQEVLEHIPDYKTALTECSRVLKPCGKLIFTIPFHPELATTNILASIDEGGEIIHHSPPEYHGDPVNDRRALCFQHFGWDILDAVRSSGFKSATAHLYWGPWQGHFGSNHFVFMAEK